MPDASFEKIAGVVSGLVTSQGRRDFVFTSSGHAVGGAAAAGLAIGGLAGAAATTAASSGDATEAVWFFRCEVDGRTVSGCLGHVGFADGDVVEMAVVPGADGLEAKAVARPADRTIWMLPHCSRGRGAYWRSVLTKLVPACFLTPVLIALLMDWMTGAPMQWDFFRWTTSLGFGGILLLVSGVLVWRMYPYAVLSSGVFRTLGFPNPDQVNLDPGMKGLWSANPADVIQVHPYKSWVFRY